MTAASGLYGIMVELCVDAGDCDEIVVSSAPRWVEAYHEAIVEVQMLR
jgi:hypothetical protein